MAHLAVTNAPAHKERLRIRAVIGYIVARPRYRVLFLASTELVAVLYSILLPFQYTQRLSLANWQYLNGELALFSVVFGLLLGAIVTLQGYGAGQVVEQRGGKLSLVGVFTGLLPSMVCCTPVIPTVLAVLGLSTPIIDGTSGLIQSFFAREELYFLLGTLILLVGSALWSLRLIQTAACFHQEGCRR